MNDISYTDWTSLSDKALMETIGIFVQHHRLNQNKSQNDVSRAANISRSTLSLLERLIFAAGLRSLHLAMARLERGERDDPHARRPRSHGQRGAAREVVRRLSRRRRPAHAHGVAGVRQPNGIDTLKT